MLTDLIKSGWFANWEKIIDWEQIDQLTWNKIFDGQRVILKSKSGEDIIFKLNISYEATYLNG